MNTIIIAEIGVNHNGKMHIAKKLIKKASEAGAHYVKFQAFNPDLLVTPNTRLADYQFKNLNKKKITQRDMLLKYALSEKQIIQLNEYSIKMNISFLLSVFDVESLGIIKKLNLKFLKIPSGEITNYLLLNEISKIKVKIILSTGMSNIKEITEAIKILTTSKIKKKDIILLQCNTDYPTNYSDINLNVIESFKKKYQLKIGFSDHTDCYIVPSLAICKGAEVIEKHITLDKKMDGPDHKASMEIKEFKKMINLIEVTERTFGNKIKKPTKSEEKNMKIVRKSIVAKKDIFKGEPFNFENLTAKRPGIGISPMLIKKLIGRKSKKNYKKNQLVNNTEFKR